MRHLQEGESSYYRQVRALKEELSQKGVLLVRTNDAGAAGASAGAGGSSRRGIQVASGSLVERREREELEGTVRRLEEKLKQVRIRSEPPRLIFAQKP